MPERFKTDESRTTDGAYRRQLPPAPDSGVELLTQPVDLADGQHVVDPKRSEGTSGIRCDPFTRLVAAARAGAAALAEDRTGGNVTLRARHPHEAVPVTGTLPARAPTGFNSLTDIIDTEYLSGARVRVIADSPERAIIIRNALKHYLDIEVIVDGGSQGPHLGPTYRRTDAFVIALGRDAGDPLETASCLRRHRVTRDAPIILILQPHHMKQAHLALEIGMTDYVKEPADYAEVAARLKVQVQRRVHADQLRQRAENSLALAMTDPLTGLGNRRHVSDCLPAMIADHSPDGGGIAALILDLDRFKTVNDRWGHAAGDRVLKEFAQRLKSRLRPFDLVARVGGEEFLVIMPGLPSDQTASVAKRLCTQIEEDLIRVTDTDHTSITVSIGIAIHDRGEAAEQLIERADQALYHSKKNGRNQFTLSAASRDVDQRPCAANRA